MMSIYICDDEKIMQTELKKQIETCIMINNYDMSIALCTADPQLLLTQIGQKKERGIYFLDVNLSDAKIDGFILGQEIRKLDPRGFIIYVTAYSDLTYKTFQYHIEALDYIVKGNIPQMEAGIRTALDTVFHRMNSQPKENQELFALKLLDTVKYIVISDIYFFETSSRTHRIILYTEHEKIDFIGSLQEIEKSLGSSFLRIHRSFLINLHKVKAIDSKANQVHLVNGYSCLLSRKMKKTLINLLKEQS